MKEACITQIIHTPQFLALSLYVFLNPISQLSACSIMKNKKFRTVTIEFITHFTNLIEALMNARMKTMYGCEWI